MTLFFHLLRAGLWNKPADPALFANITSDTWNHIYQLSVQQALIGLVYDGMCSLPADLQPDRTLRLKWFMTVQRIEQTNIHLNNTLQQFSDEMDKLGIPFYLLKGQGQAAFYPNPLRRQSGDIDIYFSSGDAYRKACEWADKQGVDASHSVKHISFTWQNAVLEFHDDLSEMHYPIANLRIRNHMRECQAENGDGSVSVGNIEVNTLSPEANLVYMMLHIFSHLITGGIGLRQFCDWARYASYHKQNINRRRLRTLLDNTGLRRFANAFAFILTEHMGLLPEQMPYEYKPDTMSAWLYADIMEGGNFGTHHRGKERPRGKWLGKWHTAKKIGIRAFRFFRLSPSETVWLPLHYSYRNIQMLITK